MDFLQHVLLELIETSCIVYTVCDERMKSHKKERERMWTTFHSLRSGELARLWSCLFEDIGIQNSDTGKILNFVALKLMVLTGIIV